MSGNGVEDTAVVRRGTYRRSNLFECGLQKVVYDERLRMWTEELRKCKPQPTKLRRIQETLSAEKVNRLLRGFSSCGTYGD